MALALGTHLGPYVIDRYIGAGGMGEVYRARDSRLHRSVAIKVIGSAFGSHPEMRRRFEEERRLAAHLDHPRIGAVYDAGHDAGVDYLVLEFLEGGSLADRIARGPIPLPEAIGYAIEIASGLAHAHSRGVIHRDLKPSNVLLTSTGVKIIDFGLGKQPQEEQRSSSHVAALKTRPPTEPSAVPGTTHYMAPERLNGLEADARADVFAFGAVVYEMATGRRAFEGDAPAAVIAAILTSAPAPLDPQRPASSDLEWVIRRCLKKNRDERWQSMADVEAVLKRMASAGAHENVADVPSSFRARKNRLVIAAAVASVTLTAAAVLARLTYTDPHAPDRMVALSIPPPDRGGFTPTESSLQSPQLAVSPDGRYLAFVAAGADGVSQIWIRPIDSTIERPLPGTSHGMYPFWSASSHSLGFFADLKLKRVDIDRGAVRSLADAPNGRGGTWNADDVILFSRSTTEGLFSISADGGVVQRTTLSGEHRETSHRWPQFLPDGRRFLFFARGDEGRSGIYLGSLDETAARFITPSSYGGVYSPPGQLLYVSDGALLAADLDAAHGRLTGTPVPLVDQIATSSSFYGAFSASANGVVAYAHNAATAELVWFGRDGRRLGVAAPKGAFADFRLSPNGRYLAVADVDPHTQLTDLRLLDMVRGTNSRLTMSPATDASPVWSPDGTRILFRSNRENVHDLYVRAANATGDDELFLRTAAAKYPTDWTSQYIVYHSGDPRTRFDLWAVPVGHPDQPRPLVRSEYDDIQGQVSPDGRWLAYTSTVAGRLDVYVQPLSEKAQRWQVSVAGGSDPRWRADGKELFYIAPDGTLMAVDTGADSNFDPGRPRSLFHLSGVSAQPPYLSVYNVDADGERFLVRVPVGSLQTLPLTLLVHWSPAAQLSR
jgi:eukaryotic-like serine/threonine-protein kinase